MGKKDFNATLYSKACRAEGSRPTLRVSELSDRYNPNKNFAGIVLWAHDGEFRWSKDKSNTNYSGRFGYVMIKSTDDWSADDFQRAGQGMVHDKMFRTVLNCAYTDGRSAAGGFAIMHGQTKFSSIWLNKQSGSYGALNWQSDDDKNLSAGEEALVAFAIEDWKRRGPTPYGEALHISDALHNKVVGGSSSAGSHTPRSSSAKVCRSDGWPTTLRNSPTTSTDSSAFVSNKTQVRDGDSVSVVQPDAGGWTMVRASNGTAGYIKSQYLRK